MRPTRSSNFSSGSSVSKRSRKNSPSRPNTVTAVPSSSTMRPPDFGFLLTPSCARASCVPVTRSIRISTLPPLSLCPNKRAGSTRVSLKTSRSPVRSSSARSVKWRSSNRCAAASTTNNRLAERVGNGTCAISSGGRSKWKSDLFKSRMRCRKPSIVGAAQPRPIPACWARRLAAVLSVTTTLSAAPADTPRCGCRRRACRSPRTGNCVRCPATG